LPNFIITSWGAFVFPRGTPPAIADKLAAEIKAIAADPAVQQRFLDIGARIISSTPQQLTDLAESERVKWKEMVQLAAIKME
jgi:tripartite-type tricarboxylate transporter receptor subunit TctC